MRFKLKRAIRQHLFENYGLSEYQDPSWNLGKLIECIMSVVQDSFEDIIKDELRADYKRYEEDYDHKTKPEYEAYGDTYAMVSNNPTDESLERCVIEYKEQFDAADFTFDNLRESSAFTDKLEQFLEDLVL